MKTEYRRATLSGEFGDLVLTSQERIGGQLEAILVDVKGWYGGVGISGEKTQRSLGHGLFPAVVQRTGRAITLEGTLLFKNEADRSVADRFVSGILWDGDEGTLTVDQGENTLSARVRLDGEIAHTYSGAYALKLQIPLSAADPFLYAPPERYQVYPIGAGVGMRFPLAGDSTHPGVVSFGDANPNTRAVIRNAGNATSYPRIRLVGDFPSGFILRDGSGKAIEYPYPVWQQSPVEVDSQAGAVFQTGMDQSIRLTHRTWFSIPPGDVNAFTVTSIQPGDGYAEVVHRDTYI